MEIIFVAFVLAGMFIVLIKQWLSPDVTLFSTMSIFLLSGIITVEEAFQGFANTSVITISLLFIISYSAFKSGFLHHILKKVLHSKQTLSLTLIKIMIPVSILSAFINNTPVVSMLTPTVRNWAIRSGIDPSKLLIPLSYAAILGGTITLYGTSTNLIIHGLLQQNGYPGFTIFEFSYIGIPLSILGVTYMSLIGRHLLPNRNNVQRIQTFEGPGKPFIIKFSVSHDSHLVGKTINYANLKILNEAALIKIIRANQTISPVGYDETIQPNDILVFSGLDNELSHLLNSDNIALITNYQKGKTALIKPTNKKIMIAVLIGMVFVASFHILSILKAAIIGVLVLFITKSISPSEARKSIDWSVIILMASAIGVGAAIEESGLTNMIAVTIIHLNGVVGLFGIALLIYFATIILTEISHNIAAAVIMFPAGHSIALEMGVDPKMFAIIIAISSTCSFVTPIGYQTNLIVYGPGGYRFTDYVKVGFLLSILCAFCTVSITLMIWR